MRITSFYLILVVGFCSIILLNGKQNYDMVLKRIDSCKTEGTKEFALLNVKISKISRVRSAFTADLILKSPFSNDVNLDLDIGLLKPGGEWLNHYLYYKAGPLCNFFKSMIPKFTSNLMKAIGTPKCPIPAGNYSIKNMDMTLDFQLPYMPVNSYKVDLDFKHKNKLAGCFQFYVDIVKKKD